MHYNARHQPPFSTVCMYCISPWYLKTCVKIWFTSLVSLFLGKAFTNLQIRAALTEILVSRGSLPPLLDTVVANFWLKGHLPILYGLLLTLAARQYNVKGLLCGGCKHSLLSFQHTMSRHVNPLIR